MFSVDKITNPDTLKDNLIFSALYLASYEVLKGAIIDRIREFFTFEFRNGKGIPNEQYKVEVASIHRDLLHASCIWLQRNGVITESEIDEIGEIRRHRNAVAHELPSLLIDSDLNLNPTYLLRTRELLEKIERWWIKNVEIPSNADFDGVEVNDKDIYPGSVVILDRIISVAVTDAERTS